MLGPIQLNASEALLCVGSRTQSSIRLAPVVCVADPGRYGIGAERSHGTCESQKKSILIVESLLTDSLESHAIFCVAIGKSKYLILT